MIELIKKYIKNASVILEIGSNDGTDSYGLLEAYKDASLYCFEPDPRGINKFKSNIKNIRCLLFEVAIGDKDGTCDLYMSGGIAPNHERYGCWDKSSSIKKPKGHLISKPWCNFDKIISVPIMRLDTWVSNNNISDVDLIWADVQGAEREMIIGGYNTLKFTKFLYTEYDKKDNIEEYEGAIDINEIEYLLPDFEIIEIFEYDVLLKNKFIK